MADNALPQTPVGSQIRMPFTPEPEVDLYRETRNDQEMVHGQEQALFGPEIEQTMSLPEIPAYLSDTGGKFKLRRNRREGQDALQKQNRSRFALRQSSRTTPYEPEFINPLAQMCDYDGVMPSIEISSEDTHSVMTDTTITGPNLRSPFDFAPSSRTLIDTPSFYEDNDRLSPFEPYQPPLTPVEQMMETEDELIHAKDAWQFSTPNLTFSDREYEEEHSRPSTANSGTSNATHESFAGSNVSLGTAATSPELNPVLMASFSLPELESAQQPSSQPGSLSRKPELPMTDAMSEHLWFTYLRYLEDPKHTPFKMLPGSQPPTGVVERIVREARKSWNSIRLARANNGLDLPMPNMSLPFRRGRSSNSRSLPNWPHHDGTVRRQLHEMCRNTTSLAPHYARMVNRTPSPFTSSDPVIPSSPPPAPRRASIFDQPFEIHDDSKTALVEPEPFSTRDMNISLVTSTADSMQPGGFLEQLAKSASPPSATGNDLSTTPIDRDSGASSQASIGSNKRSNPFLEDPPPIDDSVITAEVAKRMSINPHQRSQSLHHNFYSRRALPGASSTALASPFAPRATHARSESLRVFPADAPQPVLKSPIRLQPSSKRQKSRRIAVSEDPFLNSFARRQSHDSAILAAPPPVVRNRGFTLSAIQGMRDSQSALMSLFGERPDVNTFLRQGPVGNENTRDYSREEHKRKMAAAASGLGRINTELPPPRFNLQPQPQLASPFRADGPSMTANTFPRMHGNVQDTIMSDAPLLAPQPRRRLHGIIKPPPDNQLLQTWRSAPRGPSPL